MSANNLFSEINVNYRTRQQCAFILNTIQLNDAFIANLFVIALQFLFSPVFHYIIPPHNTNKMHFFMENLGLEFFTIFSCFSFFVEWDGRTSFSTYQCLHLLRFVIEKLCCYQTLNNLIVYQHCCFICVVIYFNQKLCKSEIFYKK